MDALQSENLVERNSGWRAASGLPRVVTEIAEAPGRIVLPLCAAITILIAVADWRVEKNAALGTLYLIPLIIASLHLPRWQVLFLAAVCAVMRESFSHYAWQPDFATRLVSGFITFAAAGLFASEVGRNHRLVLRHFRELRLETDRRRDAEAQLRGLVEGSPAAIVTLDPEGRIDLVNQAAHSLLAVPEGELKGKPIREFIPMMEEILHRSDEDVVLRTAANCKGRRANGETFLASIWFATMKGSGGRRLAAIITDSSEELRDWQHTSLQTLLRSSRVLVGSVSHEIRNICAAITVAHANLGRIGGVSTSEDYAALGTLAQTLSKLTTLDTQSAVDPQETTVMVDRLLDEFRIVVEPMLEAADVTLSVICEPHLPLCFGDHHGLLQVLLNLTRNSLRAIAGLPNKHLQIKIRRAGDCVEIRFVDSGPGIQHPERLFQPFQPGAEAVGLGLFVSRAIVRSGGGELYHEASPSGCVMCIQLNTCQDSETPVEWIESESNV
jgi:PAS domain S-box-containing protein